MTRYEPVTIQGGIGATFDIPDDAVGITVHGDAMLWKISYLRPVEEE